MNQTQLNLISLYPKEIWQLRFLLMLTGIFLIIGLFSPIVTLSKFVVIENTFSILSGCIELLKEGKYFLFIVITGFSIVLPILKIAVLFRLLFLETAQSSLLRKFLHWMHLLGKWSMLDVFVVAVLVVTVKLGVIASVETRYGLYAFAVAVVLTMYITARIVNLTDRLNEASSQV